MTRKPTRRLLAALTVVAVAAAVAAPTFAMRAASEAKTVKVTLTEFAIKLNVASVPAGTVTFKVTNKGALPHDFEIAGMRNTTGRVYAAGTITSGGPYAAVDSFLGLQYACIRSVEHLCRNRAPGLRCLGPLRSFSQWCKWCAGAQP